MATATKTNGQTATEGATTPVEAEAVAQIKLDTIAAETLLVPIVGTSPLIVHRFSEKARRQMLDNMQGRKTPKQPKDPEAEYQSAYYRFSDGRFGFPAAGFRQAFIGAGRFYSGVTMTALRQAAFFRGEPGDEGFGLFEIIGESHMREDVVAVGRGTDLRYRPEFTEWSTTLKVTFVMSMLDRQSLLSLIDASGLGVGVGEWRPEKNGDFGCFRVDPDRDVQKL